MTRPVEVVPFESSGAEWDRFLKTCSEATHHSRWAWPEVIEETFGHKGFRWAAIDPDGQLQGVLPAVHVRSRVLGSYLISMPFLNGGGPVSHSDEAFRMLSERVLAEAKRRRVDLLELRTRAARSNGLRPSVRKITVRRRLPPLPKELWAALHVKIRANVRRALRDGLELRIGAEQREPFYEVFCRSMRDLGTPVLPAKFFERIAHHFGDSVLFGAVYLKGRPIAGQCSFEWGTELEMVWGTSLREFNRHKPTSLIHWRFMEGSIERGVEVFDFGRCTPGSGTHRFKAQWGGEDVHLPWAQWSAKSDAAVPSPDRPVFRFATAVWRRLPVAVANRLGPFISGSLP